VRVAVPSAAPSDRTTQLPACCRGLNQIKLIPDIRTCIMLPTPALTHHITISHTHTSWPTLTRPKKQLQCTSPTWKKVICKTYDPLKPKPPQRPSFFSAFAIAKSDHELPHVSARSFETELDSRCTGFHKILYWEIC